MIGDTSIRRELELLQKSRGHANDNILLGSIHLVATNVEVAKVLNANAVRVCSTTTGRRDVHRTTSADHTIREYREVLCDVCVACAVDMIVAHILLQLEMIRAVELLIAGRPSVMLLNYGDPASDLLLDQPSLKLANRHERKAILGLHTVSTSCSVVPFTILDISQRLSIILDSVSSSTG